VIRHHISPGSPVFTPERGRELASKILRMASPDANFVAVTLIHTAQQITRFANNRLLTTDDGDDLIVKFHTEFGRKKDVSIQTNQLDDSGLLAAVRRAEALARLLPGAAINLTPPQKTGAFTYIPVDLWREGTVNALTTRPMIIPDMIDIVRSAGCIAAGFVGLMARASFVLNTDGQENYYRETDCECTVTARTPDGRASGWHGQANRAWDKIDPHLIATTAAQVAQRAANPSALEPGRRTAILSPAAVVQLVRLVTQALDANKTHHGMTPLAYKKPPHSKIGQRVMDARISIWSDPADPDGGYRPDFFEGLPEPKMTWVENGFLRNLAFDPEYGIQQGNAYAGLPWSFHMTGGTTPVEEMIKSCEEGIYVNRVSGIEMMHEPSGLLTGVTRDGCFYVKHGKIERPVKNFRFTESPFFFLNKLVSLGVSARAAFGYTPPSQIEGGFRETNWPRRPIIVPPMMVQDFNFNALADAV